MTTSVGVPDKWSDQSEWELGGAIVKWFNVGWLSFNTRVGALDLKAPDVPYPGSHFLWNPIPSIPPRSVIQSASIAGAAYNNAFFQSTLDTVFEVVSKDGAWDFQPKPLHWTADDPAGSFPVHVPVHVFDGATEIAATGVVGGVVTDQWPIRRFGNFIWEPQPTARNRKVGEVLTIATGGTLTSVSIRGSKVGTPTNNVWMEVYSVVAGLPDTLLATSDTRLASSFSAPGNPDVLEVFTFSGGDQIVQTLGVQYAYVLTGDWNINLSDYLQVRAVSFVLPTDKFSVTFGASRGLDSQNYISADAILQIPTILGSPSIAWSPPPFVADTVYTSPDIASLIQAWVDAPGYIEGEPILIRWRAINPSQIFARGFKSWVLNQLAPGSQDVTLTIAWRKRHMGVI